MRVAISWNSILIIKLHLTFIIIFLKVFSIHPFTPLCQFMSTSSIGCQSDIKYYTWDTQTEFKEYLICAQKVHKSGHLLVFKINNWHFRNNFNWIKNFNSKFSFNFVFKNTLGHNVDSIAGFCYGSRGESPHFLTSLIYALCLEKDTKMQFFFII